jgi:S-(hydroxymethyl)glutathione dehydrogenase/alcohol dehydrogenase
MKAVVVTNTNEYGIEDIELEPAKANEIKVKLEAAGLCHSDLSLINGTVQAPLPMVLGHEGAGIVTEVGPNTTRFCVGDHVVFTAQPVCGHCYNCMRGNFVNCEFQPLEKLIAGTMPDGSCRFKRKNGQPLPSFMGIGCLAEEVVVHEHFAVKIAEHHSMKHACITGCGVLTGVGGAVFGGHIRVGDTVVILGCGGVGLSAVQGARIAGARAIIAIDIADNKLEMAKEFGATDMVNSSVENPLERVHEILGRGADVVLECVGAPALTEQGFHMLNTGGTLVQIGVPALEETLPISSALLTLTGKTIKAGKYGDNNPQTDIPMLLDFYHQGRLDLDRMVSNTYGIDQVHQAFTDMEANINAKGVILFAQ